MNANELRGIQVLSAIDDPGLRQALEAGIRNAVVPLIARIASLEKEVAEMRTKEIPKLFIVGSVSVADTSLPQDQDALLFDKSSGQFFQWDGANFNVVS